MSPTLLGFLAGPEAASLHDVARSFATASASQGAIIHLSDGSELRIGGCYPRFPDLEPALRVAVGVGVVGQVAAHGHQTIVTSDRPRGPIHRELLGLGSGGTVSRICLPARGLAGQILGVVALHRETDRPYTEADGDRFASYADILGLRLQAAGLMDELDAHRADRERLIKAGVSAQEAERRRIANDLHDGVSTVLASMSFHLNAAELALGENDSPVAEQLRTARALSDLAYDQTRAAITGLHSLVLEDLGLVAAIDTVGRGIAGVGVRLSADEPGAFDDVPDHVAAAVFRIAQESISNAARHAQAELIQVSLRRVGDVIVLGTSDDGVGFDLRQREQSGDPTAREDGSHFGLASIAERCALIGGVLRIESRPGRGTTVLVEAPVTGMLPRSVGPGVSAHEFDIEVGEA